MSDSSHRSEHAALLVRRALVLSLVVLLVSCASGDPRGPAPARAGRATTSTPHPAPGTPTGTPGGAPEGSGQAVDLPPDAAALAQRLDDAVATLRDRRATAAQVQQAGQLQQLAVRALVLGTAAFRRDVTSRLSPDAARDTRAQVRAARMLTSLGQPRRRFPPWRILEPPAPDVLLGYYREAQRRTGVPWTYLAAINLVETRMGRIRGPSTAGARGPMQFMPATWARYGAGGDINDPRDAILAAARLLQDHGAPRDMATALWHYNPSDHYVGAVTEYARTMQSDPAVYRGYWHWQVFYQLRRGVYVLPVGYPAVRPVALPAG